MQAILVATFTHGGHTYEIYDDARSWSNARTDATGRSLFGQQGYLVEIGSQAENDAIFNQLLANNASFTQTASDGGGARYVWTGANDITNEGTWVWDSSGTQFWNGGSSGNAVGGAYNNWGNGQFGSEPDNFNSNQDAAAIALDSWPSFPPGALGSAGQWNDIATSNTMPYVVEYNAVPEPAAYALLLGTAGLVFIMVRRRRK
ncbi:MAG: lectin-like protein [Coraliomargarita sp.]